MGQFVADSPSIKKSYVSWAHWVRMRWGIFAYNFAWPDYVWLLNSWLAKAALLVPAIGYAIIFNDAIAQHISFEILASQAPRWGFLTGDMRLRMLYFGAMFLGVANFLYLVWRPYVMKLGATQDEYVGRAMDGFTVLDFRRVNEGIKSSGYDATTPYGKYSTADFEAFLDLAEGAPDFPNKRQAHADWSAAKERYGSTLRSMLVETYFRESRTRRYRLSLCITIGLAGLLMLFLPSLDLFLKVLSIIFWPAFP